MRYIFIILVISSYSISCSNELPKDILPKSVMEKVLWDVAQGGELVNGFVYTQHPELNRAAVNKALLKEIFKINKITETQFNKSLGYYKTQPKIFITMLDSIKSKQATKLNTPSILSDSEKNKTIVNPRVQPGRAKIPLR